MSHQFCGNQQILGNFCSFAFHFNEHFLLDSFLCVFCQYFEKRHFLTFQTFTNVQCVIILGMQWFL